MRWRRMVSLLLLVGAVLLPSGESAAQTCTPRQWRTNTQGVAKADITVSSTAVTVLGANGSCCQALLYNNSANAMRCASSVDGDPTATTGTVVAGTTALLLGPECRLAVKCIRSGGSDAIANVTEAAP